MARHDLYTNDPSLSTGKNLHVPGYVGTSTQRIACGTMIQSELWFETDTLLTYQWDGTAWDLLGGGVSGSAGSVVAGTLVVGDSLVINERLVIV